MEKLAHLIQHEVRYGIWVPFRLRKNGTAISHLFFADDLILFAEVSLDQAAIIKACMDDFCAVSGEKVNDHKTSIFFSSNVCHSRQAEISSFMCYSLTTDLGKYLGIPLHHKRVSKNTYQYVLQKMDDRLKQWKANSLSMAGRHTLISSVVAAVPTYAMQSAWIPEYTCREIDKKCRSFLWGHTDAIRKPHLVAWEEVYKTRNAGGLGLRHARKQNEAFMMKLGWGMVKKRDTLWVKFMREKYRCGEDILPIIRGNKSGSQAWKGIKNVWDKVIDGLGWRVGNGQRVKFWEDRWLPFHEDLQKYCVKALPEELQKDRVCDYITEYGGWDLSTFAQFLPQSVIVEIQKVPLRNILEEDSVLWRASHSGEFTVKSAYGLLGGESSNSVRGVWRKIWKVSAPQRCKNFLWLAAKGRLMTNYMRMVRGMQGNYDCYSCAGICEDIMHVLHDCKVARSCWEKILSPQYYETFFNMSDIRSWILWNLCCTQVIRGARWSVWFALLSRQLWLNRNSGVFSGKAVGASQILAHVEAQARWSNWTLNHKALELDRSLEWRPPYVGWMKVNVDGTVVAADNRSGCGGIIRDHNGGVHGGFLLRLGKGTVLHAELWAILMGLKLAWDSNFRRVVVESDCWEAVQWIIDGWDEDHREAELLLEIKQLLTRSWEVAVEWCSREGNNVADALAKESLCLAESFMLFREPPQYLYQLLKAHTMM